MMVQVSAMVRMCTPMQVCMMVQVSAMVRMCTPMQVCMMVQVRAMVHEVLRNNCDAQESNLT